MAVSYNRLWKLLIDKKMSKADLRKQAGLAPNTMTKLRRDEPVAMVVLEKICATLDTDFGDIVEYIKETSYYFSVISASRHKMSGLLYCKRYIKYLLR